MRGAGEYCQCCFAQKQTIMVTYVQGVPGLLYVQTGSPWPRTATTSQELIRKLRVEWKEPWPWSVEDSPWCEQSFVPPIGRVRCSDQTSEGPVWVSAFECDGSCLSSGSSNSSSPFVLHRTMYYVLKREQLWPSHCLLEIIRPLEQRIKWFLLLPCFSWPAYLGLE